MESTGRKENNSDERTARKERICRLRRKGQQGKDGEERTVRKGLLGKDR